MLADFSLGVQQIQHEVERSGDLVRIGGVEAADVEQMPVAVPEEHHPARATAPIRFKPSPSIARQHPPQPHALLFPLRHALDNTARV